VPSSIEIRPLSKVASRHAKIGLRVDSGRTDGQAAQKIERVAFANALQLEGSPTSRQSFWAVLANFILHMRTNY